MPSGVEGRAWNVDHTQGSTKSVIATHRAEDIGVAEAVVAALLAFGALRARIEPP